MKLYLYVTGDEYELPICVCDSVNELAFKLNYSSEGMRSTISKINRGKIKNSRIKVVEVDDE